VWPRAGAREAMGAIAGGVGTLLAVYFFTDRTGWRDPGTWGLIGSAVGFGVMMMFNTRPGEKETRD